MCELINRLNNNIAFTYTTQACQNGPKTKDNKPHPFSLGKSSSAKWKVDTLDPLDFSVTYQHGDASSPYGTPIQR